MSLNIPLREQAEYTFRIDLDEIVNDCRIYWVQFSETIANDMSTAGFWALDIKNPIFTIKGIKLVCGVDIMWPYSHADFGGFVVFDMSGKNLDPEFNGIGERWQMNYYPIAEAQAMREGLGLETI